jgi:hypothetical protein
MDPELAARYSYLELKGEESMRAASIAGTLDTVLRAEE